MNTQLSASYRHRRSTFSKYCELLRFGLESHLLRKLAIDAGGIDDEALFLDNDVCCVDLVIGVERMVWEEPAHISDVLRQR